MLSICFSMVTNGLSKHSFPWFFFCFLKNDYSCLLSNFLLVSILICRLIYIFWIPILCQLCITMLFSKFVFCLFTLFMVSFYTWKFLIWMQSNLSLFFEYFTSCLKNVCILWVHEDSFLHLSLYVLKLVFYTWIFSPRGIFMFGQR